MRKRIIAFILSLVAALALTVFIKEPQFNDSQEYVLFLLFFSIGLWFTEAIPAFSVGLFILAFLAFSLGNPRFNSEPQDIAKYVNTFSSSVIWLLLGGFLLAAALTKTGLDSALFKFTLRISGATPKRILVGLMCTTMIASMLMSNTAITAMVIAAVMPLLNRLGKKSDLTKALLIGIPIAATTGGLSTIIGTPANAIAAGALENAGIQIDFLHWMFYGVPLALFLTAISCFVLVKTFIKDNQTLSLEFLEKDISENDAEELRRKRKIVLVIVVITVLLWMTTSFHNLSVSAVAAIPIVFLTMTSVIDAKDVRGLSWDSLFLVAGGLSLGLALQETGLLTHYAQKIVTMKIPYMVFLFVLAYATMLFANVMSHTATSSVMIPLGMSLLPQFKLEVALIIGLASSTALFLPVSTPANAVAYSTGLMELKDFRLGGILIGLLGPALIIFWVLLIT
ncbi:MAG TPA: DASS family sodium-coupled anion symporter [Acidobacteriota bacterium]|nr:DASS family sodium-coupled anion symporter [Acidobacteriota bacterium]